MGGSRPDCMRTGRRDIRATRASSRKTQDDSYRRCMTDRDTVTIMSPAISVRLDPETLRALAQLESTGLSRSEAIRQAILDSAERLHRRSAIAAEAAALEADEDDRREMLEVAEFMESMRAAG